MARKTERADEIDKYIGRRIREQRENLGMTQGQLAQAISVSYQQIHKYEHGANRISAGRLWLIAEALRISVLFFYEGMQEGPIPLFDQENHLCLELARQFRQLDNMRQREAVLSLVRVLVSGVGKDEGVPPAAGDAPK